MNNQVNSNSQEMINLLNRYLANLEVLNNKICNYHWNLIGPTFITLHDKLQEYNDKATEMIDEIAERVKILNGYPITSLKEYSENAEIKDAESKDYNQTEIATSLINDFNHMRVISNYIINVAEKIHDHVTSSIMGKYDSFFQEQLWELNAMIK